MSSEMLNASISSSFRQTLKTTSKQIPDAPQSSAMIPRKKSGDGWISQTLKKSISLHHFKAIKEVYLTQKLASNTGNAALPPACCLFQFISKIFVKVNTF